MSRFAIVPAELIVHPSLSLREAMYLIALLSHKDGWTLNREDGKRAIRCKDNHTHAAVTKRLESLNLIELKKTGKGHFWRLNRKALNSFLKQTPVGKNPTQSVGKNPTVDIRDSQETIAPLLRNGDEVATGVAMAPEMKLNWMPSEKILKEVKTDFPKARDHDIEEAIIAANRKSTRNPEAVFWGAIQSIYSNLMKNNRSYREAKATKLQPKPVYSAESF